MKVLYLIFFLFISCSSQKNERLDTEQSVIDKADIETKVETTDSLFHLVKIDYHEESIQRVFVVIPAEKVNDLDYITKVVCTIKNSHELIAKSYISFFTKKIYADYKDNVFKSMHSPNGISPEEKVEYTNWRNTYYLAEYENGSRIYQTFPASGDALKMNKLILKECTENL